MRCTLPLLALGFSVVAGSALATETIFCAADDETDISIVIGRVPVAAVVNTDVSANGKRWSMLDGQIVVGQDFIDSEKLVVDYTDANFSEILIRLRLFRAYEGESFAMAGTLQIVGEGAYAITCDGY